MGVPQIIGLIVIAGILGTALRWAILRAKVPFHWGRVLGLALGLFALSLPFYHALVYHRPESPVARLWLAVGAAYLPIFIAVTMMVVRILHLKRQGTAVEPGRVWWWLSH